LVKLVKTEFAMLVPFGRRQLFFSGYFSLYVFGTSLKVFDFAFSGDGNSI